jgi:putative sterol carrier protein
MTSVSQTTTSLINLAQDLQHKDGELEAYSNRRIYPAMAFAQSVSALSHRMSDAAIAVGAAGFANLAQRMGRSATAIAENAGTLDDMARRGSTFGDWTQAMDGSIALVNEAIRALMNQPSQILPVAAFAKSAAAAKSAQHLVEVSFVETMKANQADVKNANAVYALTVTEIGGKDTKTWTIDCTGAGTVTPGAPAKADCTLQVSEANLFALVDGSLSPTSAVLSGKLQVSDKGVGRRILPLITKTKPE